MNSLKTAPNFPSLRHSRRGAILVWFVLVLSLLLAMTGLVIDAGYLMATHRHLQNSADAAALAAADDLIRGKTAGDATTTATEFVQVHNGLQSATVTVNTPPNTGPYAGEAGYVEVLADYQIRTLFIHLLRARRNSQLTRARAVAGAEAHELIDGIIALDPDARPGLGVTGNAHFTVTGRAIVNSQGGGVDKLGNPVEIGDGGSAVFVSPFGLVRAKEVRVVGGANREDRFENYELGGPHPLKANQLPEPDPLAHLTVPTVSTGVANFRRGAPTASATGLELNNPQDDSPTPNYVYRDVATGEDVMVLLPGIYSSIDVTGGRVEFRPGIFVVTSPRESGYSLRLMGGKIKAEGIMFYNTGDNYDAITGQPDILDGNLAPPAPDQASFGKVRITAGLGLTPIDTFRHSYGGMSSGIATYNGLLVFQRRRNTAEMQIQGVSDPGEFVGTVYAKWAHVRLPAGGVFQSQFVVGSLRVPGHGDLTIDYDGDDLVRAPRVYLVE